MGALAGKRFARQADAQQEGAGRAAVPPLDLPLHHQPPHLSAYQLCHRSGHHSCPCPASAFSIPSAGTPKLARAALLPREDTSLAGEFVAACY